jgi:glycerophosphoryl diester phosphodiesterase
MPGRLIIAHRGASSEVQENTHTAFLKALSQKADGFETDAQLSADEIPVLWHDDDLAKIGLPERWVDDFTFAELRRMDFTGWFAPDQAGEPLLSLTEFLREFAPLTRLLIEIKQRDDEPVERQRTKVRRCLELARLFRRTGPGLLFLSFDLTSLVYAHELDPDWPCVLNSEHIRSTEAVQQTFAKHSFLAGLCVPIAHLDTALADAVRWAGKQLATYTCNTDADIDHALALGVDWLLTDVPGYARYRREAEQGKDSGGD